MSYREQCAILAVDPYWLTPDEIAELDDWQLENIYFCQRDKHGRPFPDPITDTTVNPDLPDFGSYEEMFRYAKARDGMPQEEIDKLCHEMFPE